VLAVQPVVIRYEKICVRTAGAGELYNIWRSQRFVDPNRGVESSSLHIKSSGQTI
jgi:hypothetical protein